MLDPTEIREFLSQAGEVRRRWIAGATTTPGDPGFRRYLRVAETPGADPLEPAVWSAIPPWHPADPDVVNYNFSMAPSVADRWVRDRWRRAGDARA